MTKEEYTKWKQECPEEWNEIYQDVIKITKDCCGRMGMEHVLFTCPDANKNQQSYSNRRVLEALINKNDCCDDLIRLRKQAIDYEKNQIKN